MPKADPAFDAAFAMIAEALTANPIIEAEIKEVEPIPEIIWAEFERIVAMMDDDGLLDEYMAAPDPTQQVNEEPEREPIVRPVYWDEFDY